MPNTRIRSHPNQIVKSLMKNAFLKIHSIWGQSSLASGRKVPKLA